MVKAVGADDSIKRSLCKRQIFTVAYKKFCVGKLLCLCYMDHFRREIQTYIASVRVFLMKELDHGTGSAATVQNIVEGFFFQFRQNRRIVMFTHFINAGMIAVIDSGCPCKFFDRKLFIFFWRYMEILLINLLKS